MLQKGIPEVQMHRTPPTSLKKFKESLRGCPRDALIIQSSGRFILVPLGKPTWSKYSASSFFMNQGRSMTLQKNSAWHHLRTLGSRQCLTRISVGSAEGQNLSIKSHKSHTHSKTGVFLYCAWALWLQNEVLFDTGDFRQLLGELYLQTPESSLSQIQLILSSDWEHGYIMNATCGQTLKSLGPISSIIAQFWMSQKSMTYSKSSQSPKSGYWWLHLWDRKIIWAYP